MDLFIYNNTSYEIVDDKNFINNKKFIEMESSDSCYYILPYVMLEKKKKF